MKRKREIQLSEDMVQRYNTWIDNNDAIQKADAVTIALAIRKYASGLSKVQRLVFILRDLQDLPVEEVCGITGFKPDKVKANLFHARKFLREKLLKGGYL
jgi:DNA-directed RNA polymerase specialized sigma24 family protein